jgi:predicted nucleic acid-binding protein
MQKTRRESDSSKPRLYIDTNVLQGAISRRNTEDLLFLQTAKKENWRIFTSIHTLMELLDVAKDRKFLLNSLYERWMDVSTFLSERKTKNLSKEDLANLAKEVNSFFKDNDMIQFININEKNWELVKKIGETSNMHSSDALHLVTAWVGNCQVLATNDGGFISEGNRILTEEKANKKLRICRVQDIKKGLTEILHLDADKIQLKFDDEKDQ